MELFQEANDELRNAVKMIMCDINAQHCYTASLLFLSQPFLPHSQ